MRLSLTAKLLLSFVVVGLAGTAILVVLGTVATAGEFGQFMEARVRDDLAAELADYYAENGSWDGARTRIFDRGTGPQPQAGRPGGMRFSPFVLTDAQGTVVVAGPGYQTGEVASAGALAGAVPITFNDQTVGSLIVPAGSISRNPDEQAFLDRVNSALRIGALGGTAAAVILGALLARSVTRRLGELTQAARSVADGELETQVPVRSSDELGELATAFNQMNANLARSRDLRRQMTADVAHELRTPISVILGHAEGILDGVLEASGETLGIIHDEAARLERLVDDLRLLSLMDAGELPLEIGPTDPRSLIESAAASFQPMAREKGIALEVELAEPLPELELDGDRMLQVLRNLLNNALRHTPAGGRVTVRARADGPQIEIQVGDTGPGIPPDKLPHVFQRFYRADKSRHRDGGGSGLGLAIARALTTAQGGTLRAGNQPGSGAVFSLVLPIP